MTISIGILVALFLMLLILFRNNKMKQGKLKQIFNELDGKDIFVEKRSVLKKGLKTVNNKQYLAIILPVMIISFVFSLVFFRSFLTACVIASMSFMSPFYLLHIKKKARKQLMNYQLREALNALMSSLKAGASLSNGLINVSKDLEKVYMFAKEHPILDEFRIIKYELELMLPVEEVLINFKKRNDIEDIHDFVNVTLMTKKQGGNLNEVLERVTEIISDRIMIEQEINTLVAGKKMEAKVLTFMPIILVTLLSIISPEYMKPMYESILGRLLMIIASILLAVNYCICQVNCIHLFN